MNPTTVKIAATAVMGIGAGIAGTLAFTVDDPTIPTPETTTLSPNLERATVVRVIDGDTIVADIHILDETRNDQRVRFLNVDAPEIRDRGTAGEDAAAWLANELPMGDEVVLSIPSTASKDSFGRWLAVVYDDNVNVNEALVDAGHAEGGG